MKTDEEPPAAQDVDLFRQALDGVTPLPPTGRHHHRPAPRYPASRPADVAQAADWLSDPSDADAEPLGEFMRDGVSRATLLKLRRGRFPPQDSLDLHGCNSDEARRQLPDFLRHSREQGLRCVVVVHGKGWNSAGGEGVLKIRVRHWLTQCADALAFCEAPPAMGGGGAVLVLLKAC